MFTLRPLLKLHQLHLNLACPEDTLETLLIHTYIAKKEPPEIWPRDLAGAKTVWAKPLLNSKGAWCWFENR